MTLAETPLSSSDLSLDFPLAYPPLHLSGVFRSCPEDFIVYENLGFTPSGEGEHYLLHIEKVGQNTHWVAQQIEIALGLDRKSVGYCGRKDRHAVTRQWLSIYDPKRKVDVDQIAIEGVTVLGHTRHSQKLRPGDHESNHFTVRLRDLCLDDNSDIDIVENKEQQIFLINEIKERLEKGIPNYFGPQRFGRAGNNLLAANAWLTEGKSPSRQQRSMVMSAARSYLFNTILAARISQNNWSLPIEGDVLIDGVPTAALWGRGRLQSQSKALYIEETALKDLSCWCHGLEHCGLKQERRPTVLFPKGINVMFEGDDLVLSFELVAGAFATSVLAEIATLRELTITLEVH